MSASIVGTLFSFGFLDLAFGGSFRGEDFDHDSALAFDAIGLPPGVSLTDPTTVFVPRGTFTVNTGTNLITVSADHHLQVDDVVRVSSTGTLPAGLATATDYYVIASGLTATECKLSTTPGGAEIDITTTGSGTHSLTWTPTFANGVSVTGTPTTAGIYNISIVAAGTVSGVATQVIYNTTVVIEGDGYLAYYHLDYGEDPPQPRPTIDLQYNVRSRTFSSIAFDPEDGLELHMGETVRIHALISRNGSRTLANTDQTYTPELPDPAPTEVAIIIRPPQQFDGPAYLSAEADGFEAIGINPGDTRDVAYFDVTVGTRRLERLFRKLNEPNTAEAASEFIEGVLQLSLLLDGRRQTSPALPVKFLQTYRR